MSWTCHGVSNDDMVNALKQHGIICSAAVESAMRAVDRGLFCPGEDAYLDSPQSLGYNATISAPHMHAYCLELLQGFLKPGNTVLDVGSGSGYLTVIFAHLVRSVSGCKVVGVEHISELRRRAQSNASKVPWAASLLDNSSLLFLESDGQLGCSDYAPYDCIHVGAAATEVPDALVKQLKPGGRLLIPIGPENSTQSLCIIDKTEDGSLHKKVAMDVLYVPLTTKEHQLHRFT